MASRIGSKVQNVVIGVITAVILIVVGVALGPEVVSAMADINSTSMSGVFLGDVVVLLGDFVPFFYYLAIVIGAMAAVWAAVRYG